MIKVRIRWLIAVLSLVVVFGLSIWTVRVQSSSRALWEYRYISISETQTAQTEDILNKLGAEGWELITAEGLSEGSIFWRVSETVDILLLFKRRI